ncbi:hypothetical protein GALMADRAFT_80197 [Galerina marginata CBS 339.88]|uniref:Fe2OG dioxygenase domain-containing protein n=1 Tax=Galerina marginata (strain CBS 339.88) TaxID=685588 RepID=A0A067S8K8_GALM3|nr:hypothetical protein GALMADRAFT_80197 [Galerina marginata CBS 339.88]
MDSLLHRDSVPAFPSEIPTHPLQVIDYDLVLKQDKNEIERFWQACRNLGVSNIKNHGVDSEKIFHVGGKAMSIPMEEKLAYEHEGTKGSSFGYKPPGANLTDSSGAVDTVEWWNIAKDDILAHPKVIHRAYAPVINQNMTELKEFVSASETVARTLLSILNDRLDLPKGFLDGCHSSQDRSTCEATIIKNPGTENPKPVTEAQLAIGAHTDFGSLSLLHNICGGLQVLVPGTSTWQYVKPLDGHIICNLGDAMAIFSGGILRSNVHRVVPQPGEQGKWDRWTLVYFFRPHATCELKTLAEESPLIKNAASLPNSVNVPPGSTAEEWFKRRTKYFRADSSAVGFVSTHCLQFHFDKRSIQATDGWKYSRGTEHNEAE